MPRRNLTLKDGRILRSVDITKRLPVRQEREREYWPAGPWDDEPDKVVWVDETTGLDCMIVRNHLGALCGYVGLPPGHPWHGIGYSECVYGDQCPGDDVLWCGHSLEATLDVHGSLTYSDLCQENGDVCHVARRGRPDDVWWFGFDCAHGGDYVPGLELPRELTFGPSGNFPGEDYRDLDYVVGQVESLAEQCAP